MVPSVSSGVAFPIASGTGPLHPVQYLAPLGGALPSRSLTRPTLLRSELHDIMKFLAWGSRPVPIVQQSREDYEGGKHVNFKVGMTNRHVLRAGVGRASALP